MAALLEVKGLSTYFYTDDGVVKAVNGVSYQVEEGETLGLVGESGCGKSVSALSIMRLVPDPPGKIVQGEILFEGKDILKIGMTEMRRIRGAKIAMVFQEPMSSLNPVLTVEKQLTETLQLHKGMGRHEAQKEREELPSKVDIPDAERRIKRLLSTELQRAENLKRQLTELSKAVELQLLELTETVERKLTGTVQRRLTETVERHLTSSLQLHKGMSRRDARRESVDLLERVGIPDPARRINQYPYQFSGGMRQRVMIAMALSCNPRLIIADEPTTALDVTIQAQILELMKSLARESRVSLILITHNLGVVARYADRVNIMYAGKIIEQGSAKEIYANPRHPYTVGLLKSVPRLDQPRRSKLVPIEGQPPDLINLPEGCAFRARCPWAIEQCAVEAPPLMQAGAGHWSACWQSGVLGPGALDISERSAHREDGRDGSSGPSALTPQTDAQTESSQG